MIGSFISLGYSIMILNEINKCNELDISSFDCNINKGDNNENS
jgi:hypothetical protein